MTPCNIANLFFICPMTLSTWIRTFANHWEHSTSCWLSCDFPFVNDGIASVASNKAKSSLMLKPRSASTVSPYSNRFRNPQFCVRYLSDPRPPQQDERYDIVPLIWRDGNQNLHCIMVFIVRIGLSTSFETKWSFYEDLWTVYDAATFRVQILKHLGHVMVHYISCWPDNEKLQPCVHHFYPCVKHPWYTALGEVKSVAEVFKHQVEA